MTVEGKLWNDTKKELIGDTLHSFALSRYNNKEEIVLRNGQYRSLHGLTIDKQSRFRQGIAITLHSVYYGKILSAIRATMDSKNS